MLKFQLQRFSAHLHCVVVAGVIVVLLPEQSVRLLNQPQKSDKETNGIWINPKIEDFSWTKDKYGDRSDEVVIVNVNVVINQDKPRHVQKTER